MHLVFNDDLLQKKFERKGYIIIPSLLDPTEINYLSDLFKKFKPECSGAFHTSHFSYNASYKKQVHEAIASTVFPKADIYLNKFKPILGNFMVKNPDNEFSLDLHADWTYVDEDNYSSAAIWVPLVDTNTENGCIGVIEGSHKVTNKIRGPLIRQSTRNHEREWEKKYGTFIPMKGGDAIIYNHALLHYSHPNKTQISRPAINLSTIPQNIQCIHYCQPEGLDMIEMYNVPDSNFYIRYNHFQRPEIGTLVKTISPDEIKYMDERMQKFWKRRLLEKIKLWV